MPKINVYLPDDLADAVRESGIPVSAICQRALEQAVQRVAAIRDATAHDLDPAALAERLPSFTARLVTVLGLAAQRGEPVTSGALLHGILAEGDNLALQILTAMDIPPTTLTAPTTAEPTSDATGPRFSRSAAIALELAVGEAIGLGHNYVGCEHLLIALAAEPDGAAGETLRARGADARATRRAVSAALAGYAHLRANNARPSETLAAVLAPLIERIERLESRVG
ncbi:Clp protease N-terminal domain-containing protein [Paractinoplanes atraurantiacus]|uniref:ATP-dependent Clp protease ATP-binding subunit ClpC n=1 Tax=Paractinoplanes atraurantiacus TaxID=1036182 RepID=A0A285J7H0_9ACTN|nr:Clp protease N-terminal domain-containing protein [Actinoplanes atraurantiacus]SNY56178.1 ATP-dependent Clp protease ATP-binding subunit ClpC [Actinoplanes atraurantiacus]